MLLLLQRIGKNWLYQPMLTVRAADVLENDVVHRLAYGVFLSLLVRLTNALHAQHILTHPPWQLSQWWKTYYNKCSWVRRHKTTL